MFEEYFSVTALIPPEYWLRARFKKDELVTSPLISHKAITLWYWCNNCFSYGLQFLSHLMIILLCNNRNMWCDMVIWRNLIATYCDIYHYVYISVKVYVVSIWLLLGHYFGTNLCFFASLFPRSFDLHIDPKLFSDILAKMIPLMFLQPYLNRALINKQSDLVPSARKSMGWKWLILKQPPCFSLWSTINFERWWTRKIVLIDVYNVFASAK